MQYNLKNIAKFGVALAMVISSTDGLAGVAVIGNPNLDIDHLNKIQVKRLFLEKPSDINTHQTLQVFSQPSQSSTSIEFYRVLFHWTSTQASNYWSSFVFRGLGDQLPTIENDTRVIAVVEGTPGAIGYIDSKYLPLAQGHIKLLYQANTQGEASQHRTEKAHPIAHTSKRPTATKQAVVKHAAKVTKTPAKNLKKSTSSSSNSTKDMIKKEIAAINQSLQQAVKKSKATPRHSVSKKKVVKVTRHSTFKMPNLWMEMANQFTLQSDANQPLVRQQIAWYVNHKDKIQTILAQASPYLYYVNNAIKSRHLPAELAILPMILSEYNPDTVIDSDQAGLWQLSPDAASSMGLEQNWWSDERKNITTSTQAALNALIGLNSNLNDWRLTLAAYRSGVGEIRAAINNNPNMDFWSLPIQQQTKQFVADVVALAQIIKNPGYYGVKIPYIPDAPYFTQVVLDQQFDLDRISRLSGASIKQIKKLNPGLLQWATSPNSSYTLILPVDNANTFNKAVANKSVKEEISWQYHRVQAGENLAQIVKTYNTSTYELRKVNHISGNDVEEGQGILIPIRLSQHAQTSTAVKKTSNADDDMDSDDDPQQPPQSLKSLVNKIYK